MTHTVTQKKQNNKLRHPTWQVKYIKPEKDWITAKKPTNWLSKTSIITGFCYGFGPKGCCYGALWKFLAYIININKFYILYIYIYTYIHIAPDISQIESE